jgi:hypothetical protein
MTIRQSDPAAAAKRTQSRRANQIPTRTKHHMAIWGHITACSAWQ